MNDTTLLVRNGILLRNAWTDTADRGDVLVRDGRVATVGERLSAEVDRVVDATGKVIMPGLIQTHVHLCQTPLWGSAGDVTLMDWLRRFTWPLEAAHDSETLYDSVRWGALLLIRRGTTGVVDHETVRHTEAAFQALLESGLRVCSGKVLMDHPDHCPPDLRDSTDQALTEAADLIARYHGRSDGLLTCALNPRFVVSCTDALLREVGRLATDLRVPIHIHAHEEPVSIGMVERERGSRPLVHLHELGLLGPHTQLVHCVHLTDRERRLLADTGARVSHCPASNQVLGSGIAPVPELLRASVEVSLGSDATAFNPGLDPWVEMRDAALVQAGRLGPASLRARQVLSLATCPGVLTWNSADTLGTIEPGAKADLIVVEVTPSPYADSEAEGIIHSLVYAPAMVRVSTTIVNGRVLMDDGVVEVFDPEEVEKRGRESLKKLLKRMEGNRVVAPG